MKTYQTDHIRNISLLGNSGTGKTTFSECMLLNGGIIDRRGTVENKNTVSDYNLIEHENGNSIFSTLLYSEFKGSKINILDTPGLDDFVGGVISSLNPTDTGVMMVSASNGVEVGTEIQFRHTQAFQKALVFVINGIDHEKSNFEKAIELLKERFGNNVVLVQFPVNEGVSFNSVIDVITMKMYKFPSRGGDPEILDIPDEHKDRANELHNELVEKAAENDEGLMELFFENESLTEDEMRKGIKLGLVERGIFPVFCTSAKNNMGVSRVMEFLVNAAPAPNEVPAPKNAEGTEIKCDPNGKTSLFVFKTSIEEHIGEVNYFKVMSGEVSEGMDLINTISSNKEEFLRFLFLQVKNGKK